MPIDNIRDKQNINKQPTGDIDLFYWLLLVDSGFFNRSIKVSTNTENTCFTNSVAITNI